MPEVPPLQGVGAKLAWPGAAKSAPYTDAVAAVFARGGPLDLAMPDFEPRAGQAAMAAAVSRVFADGGVLLAEAGTGTGKTLAYLVPAILSRERVLISTGTKNLQEQIYFKDIPALREALGIPFTATYMKGRANYLCVHKLDQLADGVGPAVHDVFLPIIREWSTRTETGDRAELQDLPEDLAFWHDVSATADTCLGTECPRYDVCFVTRMRQRAAESDVVIVNHHLLCADAAVRQNAFGEVIPAFTRAILDEAHQLEDIATQYFGFNVSSYRLEELARDVERLVATGGVQDRGAKDEIAKAVERLRDHGQAFFTELAMAHRNNGRAKNEERVRATAETLGQTFQAAVNLSGALDILESTLALLRKPSGDEADGDEPSPSGEDAAALARRAGQVRDDLRFLLRGSDEAYVYFVEFRGRGTFLRASPIDVSAIIRGLLLDRMQTTVLTSATLTVDGRFDYLRARLGIGAADEIRLASEFDFLQQAILYLPPKMPDPRSENFAVAASREVIEILKRTHGRAFVLFTSYAMMRSVQAMAEMALSYPIFAQGAAPRSQLLNQFRATPHAVLFATSSFWQGVDVVGEALSCVIVDKIPFASPGDPITAARIEQIRARGGDPFGEYQVPLAILALQQGLGRLIRHRRDRGVLAVLDPRLRTMGYGRRFVASLPPAPIVHDLASIETFFG
ncbi:MAG TPA: helicase C-terminal domain-containing protein [Vicinamibacterales bacterium]|nr:helicase C-terminal domain-containing protein [Vicinamibacterales bacterium]